MGIPETFSIKKVIVMGPITVNQKPGTDRDTSQIPYQRVTSPK